MIFILFSLVSFTKLALINTLELMPIKFDDCQFKNLFSLAFH